MVSRSGRAEGCCPDHSGSSPPGPHQLAPPPLPSGLGQRLARWGHTWLCLLSVYSVQWCLRQFSQAPQLGRKETLKQSLPRTELGSITGRCCRLAGDISDHRDQHGHSTPVACGCPWGA